MNEKKSLFYAVMFFDTELNLNVKNPKPGKWINYKNLFFTVGLEALETFANVKCPASQLIGPCNSEDELKSEMETMLKNFSDQKWLNKCLYPHL